MIYTLEQLKELIAPIAEKYRLSAVYLFGSYARGTAKEASDVDLLVDTTGTSLTSLSPWAHCTAIWRMPCKNGSILSPSAPCNSGHSCPANRTSVKRSCGKG